MKARVDGAIKNHPELGAVYEQIKRARFNAPLDRRLLQAQADGGLASKIVDMDFTEISVTPGPGPPRPNFAVVAGKALTPDLQAGTTRHAARATSRDEIRDEDFEMASMASASLDGILRPAQQA